MSETTYRAAVIRALHDELAADEDVVLIGEDVGAAGGVFKATEGLFERFGGERVRDTPISEQAIVGCALGAAVAGLRPVAEIMFADFAAVCFDQIVNQLAKHAYMTDGQMSAPVCLRLVNGAGGGFGAQHSQAVEQWFLGQPRAAGRSPGTPADVYGLLRAAIRDPEPVLVFEHKGLYGRKGELPDEPEPVEIGRAAVARAGRDVTVVATQLMRERALEAAELLAAEGVELEVIDPRTLVPFDWDCVAASVARTSRLLCVQESAPGGGWGETVVAGAVERCFDDLDAPPLVLSGKDEPIPFAGPLEAAWLPSAEAIAAAAHALVEGRR